MTQTNKDGILSFSVSCKIWARKEASPVFFQLTLHFDVMQNHLECDEAATGDRSQGPIILTQTHIILALDCIIIIIYILSENAVEYVTEALRRLQ